MSDCYSTNSNSYQLNITRSDCYPSTSETNPNSHSKSNVNSDQLNITKSDCYSNQNVQNIPTIDTKSPVESGHSDITMEGCSNSSSHSNNKFKNNDEISDANLNSNMERHLLSQQEIVSEKSQKETTKGSSITSSLLVSENKENIKKTTKRILVKKLSPKKGLKSSPKRTPKVRKMISKIENTEIQPKLKTKVAVKEKKVKKLIEAFETKSVNENENVIQENDANDPKIIDDKKMYSKVKTAFDILMEARLDTQKKLMSARKVKRLKSDKVTPAKNAKLDSWLRK